SRRKHDGRFPVHAIRACLDHAKVTAADLDYVCLGWPAAGYEYRHSLKSFLTGRYPFSAASAKVVTWHFLRMWYQNSRPARFTDAFGPPQARTRLVAHHLAHAISPYAPSGFDEATVVVLDGRGAWEATSVWHGRDGRLEHVETIPWPNSLGVFYASFTHYL